jgi:hypothetical protein
LIYLRNTVPLGLDTRKLLSEFRANVRWEKKLFPDHVKFMQELHGRDLKITLNTHPADGVRGFEEAYGAMCKALGQNMEDDHVSIPSK